MTPSYLLSILFHIFKYLTALIRGGKKIVFLQVLNPLDILDAMDWSKFSTLIMQERVINKKKIEEMAFGNNKSHFKEKFNLSNLRKSPFSKSLEYI